MLPESLKTVLSADSQSMLAPKLSRKTILLKKKNKALQHNKSHPELEFDFDKEKEKPKESEKTQHQFSRKTSYQKQNALTNKQQEQLKMITGKKDTEQTAKYSGQYQSNSVSCQTSNSLLFFPQENCEFYSQEIPANDPIWLEIIPPELLRENSIEKLLDDNKEYFYNLLGLYLQERMQSDFNMSRFSAPLKWQTSYEKDFDKKQIEKLQTNGNLDSRFYDDYKQCHNSQFSQSAYKNQFRTYNSCEFNPRFQNREYQNSNLQMSNLTTYKANHVDYKLDQKPELFRANKSNTINGSLQLNGQTHYAQEYKEYKNVDRPQNCKNNYSKLNPIQNSNLFFGREKLSFEQMPQSVKEKHEPYSQTPTYKGQFVSTFKHDFQDQERVNELKMQVKNWRQHIVNKMNQMREMKSNTVSVKNDY